MRKLAHNSGQVPSRYRVKSDTLSVEDNVIASGAFSDIRRGRLDGRTVAVRTLRTGLKDAQKVRAASCYFQNALKKDDTKSSASARSVSFG